MWKIWTVLSGIIFSGLAIRLQMNGADLILNQRYSEAESVQLSSAMFRVREKSENTKIKFYSYILKIQLSTGKENHTVHFLPIRHLWFKRCSSGMQMDVPQSPTCCPVWCKSGSVQFIKGGKRKMKRKYNELLQLHLNSAEWWC